MARTYTIKAGDTLWDIAEANDVTVKAIKDANPSVDPNRLLVGKVLTLPDASPASAPVPAAAAVPAASGPTYTVKKGDNLTKIAIELRTTVARLKEVNNLKSDRINIGQKLKVPQP